MQNDVSKVFSEQEANILDVVWVLWRSKIIILVFSFLGVLAAAGYIFSERTLYEAKVFVLPPHAEWHCRLELWTDARE